MEIFNFDVRSSERYANDQKDIEAFRRQYHVLPSDPQASRSAQTKIVDTVRKPTNVESLFKTTERKTWSGIDVPPNFFDQSYRSSYIAPSLGADEKMSADIQRIQGYVANATPTPTSARKKEEGEDLINLLDLIKTVNSEIDFVNAMRNRYVKG